MKIFKRKGPIAICSALLLALSLTFCAFTSSDKHNLEVVKNLDLFYSIFKEINLYYVDQPDSKKMVKTAVDNMLKGLDPYTVYIPEEEMDDFRFMTTGEYGGVGSIISMSTDTPYVKVREIYKGFPADEAGLRAGDLFVEIDGKSVRGATTSQVSNLLRGTPQTQVKLKMMRPGVQKPFEVTAKRRKIQINPVTYYGMVGEQTGYIALSSFTEKCHVEVRNALLDLRDNHGATSLVLDLRGNPGGLLNEAIDILSLFLPQSTPVLLTKGRATYTEKRLATQSAPVDTTMRIAVLIDRGSASASEIVAGAIQDLDRGVVIGQRSYGKGLVQSTRNVDGGGCVKLTTAKYYTPSGRCIQALDYSNRDKEGAVGYVPDSLITEYKTRGGRTVYDGGGISPDVNITGEKYANISVALIAADVPFNYAVKYRVEHPQIASAADFALTDEDYRDFCAFVEQQPKFTYKNRSSDALEKLMAAAKADKYYDENQELFESLGQKLKPELQKDLELSQKQICNIVEEEILTSFYYASGYAPKALQNDSVAQKAVSVLADAEQYYGLLRGTVPSHAGDKRQANKVDAE